MSYFPTKTDFLTALFEQLHHLFNINVFLRVVHTHHSRLRKVLFFSDCVRHLLFKHPEVAYFFKAYYSPDVFREPAFSSLSLRRASIKNRLANILLEAGVSDTLAQPIAAVYLDTLGTRSVWLGSRLPPLPIALFLVLCSQRRLGQQTTARNTFLGVA